MKIHEIITTNEKGNSAILTELLYKYKKSLYIYYKNLFCCEPVLMVTTIFNAAQYAIIAPSNEINEAMEHYLNNDNMSEEDREREKELILFQSIMLKDF